MAGKPYASRHPSTALRIVTASLLFAVAQSLTGAAAADHSAAPVGTGAAARAPELTAPVPRQAALRLGAAAGAARQPGRPTHVAEPAPVTRAVISGLAANGIPSVALNAYRVAAARLAHNDPGCGLDWALLAGIGREESDHGRFAGATLNADGTSTPHIVGPALTGARWDYIPAPANGRQLDGDAVYAHALGPMQFIPTTWAAYRADADGDGVADIFDIDDAALAAARYLCTAGGDLRTAAGQRAAILAYNHSDQYLAQVLALAAAYRAGIAVTGIPVGDVTGALPPVEHTGQLPPANPAGPTAVTGTAAKTTKARTPAARSRDHPAAAAEPGSTPASGAPRTGAASGSSSAGSRPGSGGGTGTGTDPASTPAGTPASSVSAPADPTSAAPAPPSSTSAPRRTCLLWDLFVKGKCDLWL